MTPEMMPFFEKTVATSLIGTVLLIIVWKLPTVISMFMENRKEVAAIMDKQTDNFSKALRDVLDRHENQTSTLINKFENRFTNIETTLKDVCHVLERNQQTIQDLLESRHEAKH